jgi:C4-type Zn-finger protein
MTCGGLSGMNLRCPSCRAERVTVKAEHEYPHRSHPAHYLAQCEACRGYWTIGFLHSDNTNKVRELRVSDLPEQKERRIEERRRPT